MTSRPGRTWWRWAGLWLALGAFLRMLLIVYPRSGDDDSNVYLELGRNLLHHGTYGLTSEGDLSPALFRLPGYPIFLGLLGGNLLLVFAVQSALDLLGCLLLGLLVRRMVGARAGLWTVVVSATCLFTAVYAACALTESLSVFAVSLAMWSTGNFLAEDGDWTHLGSKVARRLLPAAAACALAMLLRPDGALLTAAVLLALVVHGFQKAGALAWRRTAATAALFSLLALLPLVPWTVRNAVTFGVFEPLAPRHVNDPAERVNLGFYRWMRTWSVEFLSTAKVFWHVGTQPIAIDDLPPRAFDSPAERVRTAALLARYNASDNIDQPLDDAFGQLAEQRVRAHPLRYYVWVPALRIADMALRPRTDAMSLPPDWWNAGPRQRPEGCALGLLNLAYVLLALAAALRRRIPLPWLLLGFAALRCCLLGTIENAEPRYTLEMYPVILVGAGITLAGLEKRFRHHDLQQQVC